MSARLLGLAFDAEAPSASAKLVLIKLVDCCDDEGRKIFPAVSTLARAAQCDTRTVQRHLALFCTVGLLRRVREGGAGRGSTTHYEMNIEVLRLIAAKGWAAVAGLRVAESDEPEEAEGEPATATEDAAASHAENAGQPDTAGAAETAKGGMVSPYPAALRVTNSNVKGDTGVTQPLKRIPQEEERERVGGHGHGSAPTGHAADAGEASEATDGQPIPRLADFVKAWPSGAVDSMTRMEAAWGALSLADRREALRRVPDFIAENKRQRRSHVPAGQTYLYERKWLLLSDMKRSNDAEQSVQVKPFSKGWWALFHHARAGRGGNAKLLMSWADQNRLWTCKPREVEAARPDALRPAPAHGEAAQAFLAEARRGGFHFPKFGESAWIFLPEQIALSANSSAAEIDQLQRDGGLT